MRIFRIADSRHPIWDGTGAALVGGCWNSPGRPVIYGSLSYACAMLEILVHAGIGRVPRHHRFVKVAAPPTVSVEHPPVASLPSRWDTEGSASAQDFGDRWLQERRSAILIVPSVVARHEWNALVNPAHPEAGLLHPSVPQPVEWDRRLRRL